MVHFFLAFFEQANHPLFRRLHHTLAFRNIINSRFVYRSPGQTDVRGIDWSRVSQQATVRCSARSFKQLGDVAISPGPSFPSSRRILIPKHRIKIGD